MRAANCWSVIDRAIELAGNEQHKGIKQNNGCQSNEVKK
jgi:hypothetical protein